MVGPRRFGLAALVLAWMGFAVVAHADPCSFVRISNNASVDIADQLLVEVSDQGGGVVGFRFTNTCTVPGASVARVYFDDGVLFGIASIDSSAGVAFSQGADPGDLPGGNALDPPFVTSHDFLADADPPVYHNGVNAADEWLDVFFELQSGRTYQELLSDLGDGTIRIGLHVQAIGPDGDSDAFVNIPPLPAPGAVVLGAIGLGLVGWFRKRSS